MSGSNIVLKTGEVSVAFKRLMRCCVCYEDYIVTQKCKDYDTIPGNQDEETTESNSHLIALKCGHQICFNCMKRMNMSSSKRLNRCPLCKKVGLNKRSIRTLIDNDFSYFLNFIIERLHSNDTKRIFECKRCKCNLLDENKVNYSEDIGANFVVDDVDLYGITFGNTGLLCEMCGLHEHDRKNIKILLTISGIPMSKNCKRLPSFVLDLLGDLFKNVITIRKDPRHSIESEEEMGLSLSETRLSRGNLNEFIDEVNRINNRGKRRRCSMKKLTDILDTSVNVLKVAENQTDNGNLIRSVVRNLENVLNDIIDDNNEEEEKGRERKRKRERY